MKFKFQKIKQPNIADYDVVSDNNEYIGFVRKDPNPMFGGWIAHFAGFNGRATGSTREKAVENLIKSNKAKQGF